MKRHNEDGFVLVAVLTLAFLIVMMLVISSSFSISSRQAVAVEAQKIPAFYAANTGIERARAQIATLLKQSKYITMTPGDAADSVYSELKQAGRAQVLEDTINGDFTTDNIHFKVTATHTSGESVIQLVSVGTFGTNVFRKVQIDYNVNPSQLAVNSNAAVETPGDATMSGTGANILGQKGAPVTADQFSLQCTDATGNPIPSSPVTQCTSSGSPLRYNVYIPPSSDPTQQKLPAKDDYIAYPVSGTDPKSSIRYRVISSDPATRKVSLEVVNENSVTTTTGTCKGNNCTPPVITTKTPTPLRSDAVLAPTTEVAALFSGSGTNPTVNGNSPTCTQFFCDTPSNTRDALFKATFGVSMTDFKNGLSAGNLLTNSDVCPTSTVNVQWWTTSQANNSLASCTANPPIPRILIIDARTANNKITVNVSNANFYGLLYVISNEEVTIQANGVIAGAAVIDIPQSGDFFLKGTGQGNCGTTAVPGKVCYDSAQLAGLLAAVKNQVSGVNTPTLGSVTNTWAEVAGN